MFYHILFLLLDTAARLSLCPPVQVFEPTPAPRTAWPGFGEVPKPALEGFVPQHMLCRLHVLYGS